MTKRTKENLIYAGAAVGVAVLISYLLRPKSQNVQNPSSLIPPNPNPNISVRDYCETQFNTDAAVEACILNTRTI
jgi:hypothetical protein